MPSSSEGYSEGDSVWNCEDCNVTCNSEPCYEAHIKGKRHRQNVGKNADRAAAASAASSPVKWSCDTCSVTCVNERSLQDHLAGKKHAFNVKNTPAKEEATPTSWSCDLCDVECKCEKSYNDHKAGKMHARKEKRARDRALSAGTCGNEDWYCDVCTTTCTSKRQYDAHLEGTFHATRTKAASEEGKRSRFRCDACEVVCSSERHLKEHESGRRHLQLMILRGRIEEMTKGKERKSTSSGVTLESASTVHCHICDCSVVDQESNLRHHLKGHRHIRNLRACVLERKAKGQWYKCDVCNIDSFSGPIPYFEHQMSPSHKQAVDVLKSFHSKNEFSCDVCKVPEISGFAQYLEHVQSSTHVNTVNAFVRVSTHCDFCNRSCNGVVPYVDHLDSASHKKKVAAYTRRNVDGRTKT